jgi:hypothetical protein
MPNGIRFNPTKYSGRKAQIDAARNAITRLQQIEANIVGSTAAQTQQAVKDIATYERHLIRIVAGEVI